MRKLFAKFVFILVSIFALETLIMRLMDVYGLEGTPIEGFVDAFTLTILIGPIVYFMFVRQLNMELTERMALLVRLEKLNRARMTISDCNQALIRAEDEKQLLDNLCRVITETGGYRMAWVGFAEHDEAKTVKPVAFSGYDEGYVEKLDTTWADTELGQNPIGKAIRSGQPVIVRKIALDAHFQSGGGGNGGDETRLRLFSVASVGRG